MNQYAPITIFCYRRPEHLSRMLISLAECEGFDQSPIIVYGDGPKDKSEESKVMKTREVAIGILGSRAEYHFRDKNAGLAESVIEGVSDVVGRFGCAIVIEDDLELAPGFLTYMNRALERFADDDRVWQVSGFMFDVPELENESHALFLPFSSSWGWATWKRAWDYLDLNCAGWQKLMNDPRRRKRFSLDGAYRYDTMLLRQMKGLGNSWAIKWYWTVFQNDGVVIYPPFSLVANKGFDGAGTNGEGVFRRFSGQAVRSQNIFEINMPEKVEVNKRKYCFVKNAIRALNGGLVGLVIDQFRWWKS